MKITRNKIIREILCGTKPVLAVTRELEWLAEKHKQSENFLTENFRHTVQCTYTLYKYMDIAAVLRSLFWCQFWLQAFEIWEPNFAPAHDSSCNIKILVCSSLTSTALLKLLLFYTTLFFCEYLDGKKIFAKIPIGLKSSCLGSIR